MNEEVDLSNYQEDAAYKLVNTTAQRNDVIYPCCPESYPDVTYTVTMQPVQP
jgi:nicotinic acetylcholine receptor